MGDSVGVRSDRGHELSRQAGLPDSGVTNHREPRDSAGADCTPERGSQPGQLALAPEHRRVESPRDGGRTGDDLQDLPAGGPGRSAVQRFHDRRTAEEPLRCRPDENFAIRRGVLQSTRHPDQRPRNRIVNRGPGPRDHDLSGFHARPRPAAAIVERSGAIVQPSDRCLCFGDGAQRSERVVLVRDREPEERDQRIPELALDAAAVPLDHLGRNARAAGAEAPDALGIHVRGRDGGDVEDGNGHRPALAGQPGRCGAGRRGPGAVRQRLEHGVLPQDRRLELTQRGAGFEAQLLDEQRAGIVVRLEGGCLPSGAVERKHQ